MSMGWKEAKKWAKKVKETIKAPIEGTVHEIYAEDGEVQENQPLYLVGNVTVKSSVDGFFVNGSLAGTGVLFNQTLGEIMQGDWRNGWKYGQIIRGLGCCDEDGGLIFDWGPEATKKQKDLLTECIGNMSKWADKVEAILDDPPTADERKLFKKMKKLKLLE